MVSSQNQLETLEQRQLHALTGWRFSVKPRPSAVFEQPLALTCNFPNKSVETNAWYLREIIPQLS